MSLERRLSFFRTFLFRRFAESLATRSGLASRAAFLTYRLARFSLLRVVMKNRSAYRPLFLFERLPCCFVMVLIPPNLFVCRHYPKLFGKVHLVAGVNSKDLQPNVWRLGDEELAALWRWNPSRFYWLFLHPLGIGLIKRLLDEILKEIINREAHAKNSKRIHVHTMIATTQSNPVNAVDWPLVRQTHRVLHRHLDRSIRFQASGSNEEYFGFMVVSCTSAVFQTRHTEICTFRSRSSI